MAAQTAQAVALVRAHMDASAARGRYCALMEHASDAVVILDQDGVIQECNRRLGDFLPQSDGDRASHPGS